MLQIILINYLSCSTYKNTLNRQMKRRQPVNLKYRTKRTRKKIARNSQNQRAFFRLNRHIKQHYSCCCCIRFVFFSFFSFSFHTQRCQISRICACERRAIVHAFISLRMCIELSLNLNLKSNCQYKIRCQSHFYLFFGDEIWWASKA